MESYVFRNDNYVKIFEKCPYRNGWICVLQVPTSEWENVKYDEYRTIYKIK